MLPLASLGAFMAFMSPISSTLTMPSVPLIAKLAIAAAPGLVSAANNIKMINHCPYDLYSWTVGPAGSGFNGHDHEVLAIPANSVSVHGMVNTEAIGGGIALKLRDLPKYQIAPAGIIQVEYNLIPSKNNIWYDLSAVDCDHAAGPESPSFCPLIGGGMKLYVAEADETKCPPAWCGADGCHNTYTRPGSWQGEPTFRCDVGVDIVVEMCTERAGATTFNRNTEPDHAVDPYPDVKPGGPTQDGVCGARAPGGATCFGYTHGNCCSSYGWCGFSEVHCGEGCQAGFGNCSSSGPGYRPPAQLSSVKPSYSKPVSSFVKPTPSYAQPTSVYVQSTHTNVEQTWPVSSYGKPTSSYAGPSAILSSYVEPTPGHSKSASVYEKPPSGYSVPVYSYTLPVYSQPNHISVYTPALLTQTPDYTPPAHTPEYSPPYSPPPYTIIYATHTVTETHAQFTETIIVSSWYNAPTTISTIYHAPPPPATESDYQKPTHTHTLQQEPQIPASWYNDPVPTPAGPVYYPPVTETYAGRRK